MISSGTSINQFYSDGGHENCKRHRITLYITPQYMILTVPNHFSKLCSPISAGLLVGSPVVTFVIQDSQIHLSSLHRNRTYCSSAITLHLYRLWYLIRSILCVSYRLPATQRILTWSKRSSFHWCRGWRYYGHYDAIDPE